MTVLAMSATTGRDGLRRSVPWRRMAWVTWRQHRPTLIAVPVLLGAAALFLWIAGLKVHRDYAALIACHPFMSSACQALNDSFNHTDWPLGNTVGILMQLVPPLLGAFAGAPVLARELETGTFRYAWSQGFGRARHTIARLAMLAVAVTATAWAFSQVFNWFFKPFLIDQDLSLLSGGVFDTHGIAFAAWVLAAFAIGAFAGMLIRRVIPAMAVTLGAYFGLNALAWLFLRAHYPVSLVTSDSTQALGASTTIQQGPVTVSQPWIVSTWYTGPGNKPASQSAVNQVLALFPTNGAPKFQGTLAQALTQHGITQWFRYIPLSRFWPMQLIEGGWLVALSALLIAGTVWLVRHRAA
jgi:hypothetical protein